MTDLTSGVRIPVRRAPYGRAELGPLIEPRGIAVIGASNKPGYGLQTLRAIRGGAFDGPLYAVHPRETDVDGVATVAGVRDLPEPVDLALIGIKAELVPSVLAECVERGVRAALIHAAGFAETGTAEGLRLQREVEAIVAGSDLRVAGPNCLGLWNFRRNLSLARRLHVVERPGTIGIVSQSGGLGSFLFDVPGRESLFSYCLCTGNSLDIDVFDLVNFLVEDERTRAIVLVLEGVGDGERLLEVGARARAAGKPIVAFKAGRTERGAQAALSHTASIAGGRELVDAAFARAGIITVEGYDDLIETAVFLSRARPGPAGVGVATTTGGFAVMACDAADEADVALPPPSPATVEALREVIPGFGSIGNPADLAGGPGGAARFAGALRAFAADPGYGTVVVPLGPSMDGARERVLDAGQVAESSPANITVYWVNPWDSGAAMEAILADPRLSVFRSLRRMFHAVRAWHWWSGLKVRPPSRDRAAPPWRAELAALLDRADRGGPGVRVSLSEHASRQVCAVAGVPVAAAEFVTDRDAAAAAAARFDTRTVVKVVSPDLPHKSEAGGVRVGLAGAEATAEAFDEVVANAHRHDPDARVEGALVSPMLSGVAELLVGARRDPALGPAIVLNWGGTEVELLGSPVVRLVPVDLACAHDMLRELPGYRRLTGYRGTQKTDLDALAATLVAISELIGADDRIVEVELNPVLAMPTGAAALDALVVLDPTPQEGRP